MANSIAGETSGGPVRHASDERLAGCLLALHAATDAEGLWRAGVEVLRAAMPSFHYLMGLPTVGTRPVFLRTTLPLSDELGYWARLDRVAPMEKMLAGKTGRKTVRLSNEVPFLLLRLTSFYRQFMKPEGWRYSAGMFFWDGDRFLGQFSQNRTPAQGDYTNAEMVLLGELHPHFETAVNRVLLLDRERAARLSLEESVQRSPLPTAVLSWQLEPLFHNRAAVEATSVWRLGPEAARAVKAEFALPAEIALACRELRAAWEQALVNGTPAPQTHERVIHHGRIPAARAVVRLFEPDQAHFTDPHFLVQFSLLHASEEPDDAVQMLARLTPAERSVAMQAARGLDNQRIADELTVSCSTVRTHLRSIFSKLGITSRARLAALQRALERQP